VHGEIRKFIEKENPPLAEEMREKTAHLMSRREWAEIRIARVELSEKEAEQAQTLRNTNARRGQLNAPALKLK